MPSAPVRPVRPGRRPARLVTAAAAVLATAALGLTACSSGGSPAPSKGLPTKGVAHEVDGVQQITVIADSNFRFYPSTIVVHQGPVRITLVNPKPGNGSGAPPHDLQVNGVAGAYGGLIPVGHRETISFTAPEPGTYPFECTIHTQEGMFGKLVVEAGS